MSDLITEYESAAQQTNCRRAMQQYEDAQLIELLKHYWELAKPIRRRCHNATQRDVFVTTSLAMAYNRLNESNRSRMRPTACQIPHNVAQAERYLKGRGVI